MCDTMKTEMKLNDLMESPHYESILTLTMYFQDKEKGLRLMHYRWALIENHDNINQNYFVHKMNDFFSSSFNEKQKDELTKLYREQGNTYNFDTDLHDFYKRYPNAKGCIKGKYANNNLSNFLNKLVYTYKILNKYKDTDGIERYYLNDYRKLLAMTQRKTIKRVIETLSDEKIFKLFHTVMEIDLHD